ncbi:MAG TPA: hypothetical protein VF469_11265 [Kofleriaceae bacterium]
MATTDMSTPVTRGELRAEIEQLEIRLEQKLDQKLDQKLAHVATKADLEVWGQRLLTELARHTKAIEEALSAQVSVVDEKYADLPGRVKRLETTVLGPKRRG